MEPIFFYGHKYLPYGCFSNFWHAPFGDDDDEYGTVEQYMHYHKAVLFGDKNLTPANSGVKKHGGHLREDTFLTIRCFKKFCLKARTKKADEIHDYYLTLEETLQETVEEESSKLREELI